MAEPLIQVPPKLPAVAINASAQGVADVVVLDPAVDVHDLAAKLRYLADELERRSEHPG